MSAILNFVRILCNSKYAVVQTSSRLVAIFLISKIEIKPSYDDFLKCLSLHIIGLLSIPSFIRSSNSILNPIVAVILFPLLLKEINNGEYFIYKIIMATLTIFKLRVPTVYEVTLLPYVLLSSFFYISILVHMKDLLEENIDEEFVTLYLIAYFFSTNDSDFYIDGIFSKLINVIKSSIGTIVRVVILPFLIVVCMSQTMNYVIQENE
jgi:hypothetical protein